MGRGGSNDRPFHGPTRSTLEGLADYVWIWEQEVLLGVEEMPEKVVVLHLHLRCGFSAEWLGEENPHWLRYAGIGGE